jgi:hypothetical protein
MTNVTKQHSAAGLPLIGCCCCCSRTVESHWLASDDGLSTFLDPPRLRCWCATVAYGILLGVVLRASHLKYRVAYPMPEAGSREGHVSKVCQGCAT